MRIRIATMLLAGSFFGLPLEIVAQEIEPSFRIYYNTSWEELWITDWCGTPSQMTLETYSLTESVYNPPTEISVTGWGMMPCWPGCEDHHAVITWPGPGLDGQRHRWGNGAWINTSGGGYWDPCAPYDEYLEQPPFLDNLIMGYRTFYQYQTRTDGYIWDQSFGFDSSIELSTGGTPGVTNSNFVMVQMMVRDRAVAGWPPIPVSAFTLWGRAADTNVWAGPGEAGVWYAALPDHATVDVTPEVTGDWTHYDEGVGSNGDTSFTSDQHISYEPVVQKSRLVIRNRKNGSDLTLATNVFWVGEAIDLECVLQPPFNTLTITGYEWTVPGKAIADWVVGPGLREEARYAQILPLTNLTSATNYFYWVQDEAQAEVTCAAQVAGHTLIARATFEVRRPDATWTLTYSGVPRGVDVTTNCDPVAPEFAGYYHLTTGPGYTTNTAGMVYEYAITDLKGFTGPYSVSWGQIVSAWWQANVDPGVGSWQAIMTGLDGRWPYNPFQGTLTGKDTDTPMSALLNDMKFFWRRDKFYAYLMWRSWRTGTDSIAVPLKVGIWNWYGAAEKLDTNTPPTWHLVQKTDPRPFVGFDVYDHPQWTNIVTWPALMDERQTNNFYYPTP